MKNVKTIVALAILGASCFAHSLEQFKGKVTYLEPTYMPNSIRFNMDGGNTTCPAGKAITWDKNSPENHQAVYSTLLAAFMSGKTIRMYINDGDTSCQGQYMHILPNN